MSHTVVGFGQHGEAANCCVEETNRSRLKSVSGRKESICRSPRTSPACTQRLQLWAMFWKLSNQRARVTARLCCQEPSWCGKQCVVQVFLPAFFLLVCAGHRLQNLPLWLAEADSQGLLVFHLSLIIHYRREVEDVQSKLSCDCHIKGPVLPSGALASLGSTPVLTWALAPNPSHCLHIKLFHCISAAKAYPDRGEVIFTPFSWLAAVASPKIPWSSWGPVFPLPLPCFTAHPRLPPFPQNSLGSFFTNSVLSLLPTHKARRVPSVELLALGARTGLNTDTFSEGWWRRGECGSKTSLGQPQASKWSS